MGTVAISSRYELLLRRCWSDDPTLRPVAAEVLEEVEAMALAAEGGGGAVSPALGSSPSHLSLAAGVGGRDQYRAATIARSGDDSRRVG